MTTSQGRAEGVDARAALVLDYWFTPDWPTASALRANPEQLATWFQGGARVDEEIRAQFLDLHQRFATTELDGWLHHPANALAAVIVMDQFSRHVYRGKPEMYALDAKALAWAKHILENKLCESFPYVEQLFLGLPSIHSEVLADQQEAVAFTEQLRERVVRDAVAVPAGSPDEASADVLLNLMNKAVDMAERHAVVVAQWGRFPHRNEILGRESTPEEVQGLADGSIERF